MKNTQNMTVSYLRCYERKYPKIMQYLRLINNSGIDIKEIMSIGTSQGTKTDNNNKEGRKL